MKRFFLIPLMTLCTCVMAWGHNGHTSQLSSDVAKAVLWSEDPDDPWGDPIVTTVYFSNISDALSAATSSTDDPFTHERTITLLKNVDASSTTWTDEFDQDLVFDLNGNTLAMNIIYNIWGGNKLTIKNGTFNGTLDYGEYSKGCFYLEGGANGLAGTITCNVSNYYQSTCYYYLNSGTISANLTFSNTSSKNTTVYVKTLVTGNIVNGDNNKRIQLNMAGTSNDALAKIIGNITLNNNGQLYMGNYSETTGTVTMNTGSTFTVGSASANVKCNLVKNEGTTSFSNGKFYSFDPTPYLGSGYMAQNEGDYYSILSSVAQNMTKAGQPQYTDFMSAYNAADAGDSIVVLKGVSISGTLNLNKNVRIGGKYSTTTITINAGSDVTFNNENQKVWCVLQSQYESTLTFNAGTYKQCNITNGNVTVNGGEVTLTSLTIPAGKTFTLAEGNVIGSSVTANLSGTININGGSLSIAAIKAVANSAKVYMTDGNATFSGAYYASNKYAGIFRENQTYDGYSMTDLKLTGGTITCTHYTTQGGAVVVPTVTGEFLIKDITINNTGDTQYSGGGSALVIAGTGFDEQELVLENCNLYSANSYGFWADYGYWTLKNNNIEAKKAAVFGQFVYPTIKIVSGTYTTTGENEEIIAVNGLSEIKVVSESSSSALFSKKPADQYIADGYVMEKIGDWWQLTNGPVVALVNGQEVRKYSDLLNAFLGNLSFILSQEVNIVMQMDYDLTIDSPLEVEAGWTCNLDLNGHVLTVNGRSADKLIVSGTFNIDGTDEGSKIVSQRANCFKVNNGGELNINGGTYKTTQQQSENITYQNEVKQIQVATSYIVRNLGGTVKLTNATFDAGCYAVDNRAGSVTIKGGAYSSSASVMTGEYLSFVERYHHYGYAIANAGTMSLINATVTGVHGAVICKDEKGVLDIDGCELITENSENLEDANGALVVATNSMVTVKNTKMKSPRANYAAHVGDLDEGKTFGIVNLYAGCYLTDKMYVEQATTSEGILFPMSVAETSAWYEVAVEGGNGPLPAGYEYAAVENAGDDADEYAAGYRWKVVLENEAQKAADGIKPSEVDEQESDPTYTIPWQKNTTWVSDEVPEDHTIVTIPVDAVVAVSQSESVKEAVAEQIFVSAGATLKVEEGTTLTVGEGGVNIANGGQLVVEPGAVVTVGSAGLVTTEEEALVIEATEEDQGVFLLKPEVTENTQPKATVKLVTKAKQVGANEFIWERFAIPTIDGSATIYDNEGLDTVHYYGEATSLQEGLYEWSDASQEWVGVSSWKNLQPFKGYQLTNNSKFGNVVYTFEGNLVGNADKAYEFTQSGFGFFGNSYTGDIDIKKFFESFGENMQKTIWIYDYYVDAFKAITETSYGTVYYGKRNARHGLITDIRSMQAFLMNTFAAGESTQNVDYSAAIWGNPKYGLVSNPNQAPKRVAANEDGFTVYVAGAKQEDEVSFIRSNAYSAAFDNGADASKWMNKGINLYVATENGELATVASDEIVDMTIAFRSGNETEYTLGFDNLYGETFELRDVITGATILMVEGATYTFTQEPNTTIPARFQIVGAHKMPTGVENISEGATVQQKVMKNGTLYILRDNKWYSAQGQLVK